MRRCLKWTELLSAIALLLIMSTSSAVAQVNLRFAMWISNQAEIEAQQGLIKKYEAMNPGVRIDLVQQGWGGYHDKLLTMAAGGIAPDVMVLSRLHLPTFAEQSIVQPIDPWFLEESPQFRGNIVELVSGTYKNQVYGIPIWGGPMVAEYNADRFDSAGLAQPTDLAQQKTWTWDVFVAMGKKITRDDDGDGNPDAFMHAKLGTRASDWYVKLRTFGADLIREDGQPFTDISAIGRGLEFWSGLALEHHITPIGQQSSSFTRGTEAAYFTWISDAPTHFSNVKNAFRVELTTPPTGPNGDFTLVGGCPITIASSSGNPDEAYKFARWYAMESQHWKLRGSPPGWDDMRNEYRSYLASMYSWPEVVVEAMAGEVAMEPGVGPHFNDLNSGWNSILQAVAAGTMAPREGAIRLVEHTEAVLKY